MEKPENVQRVCELRSKLMRVVEDHLGKNVSAKEMGEVVDMIKDLSQCEKDMYEAQYYKDKVGNDNEKSFSL